MSDSPEVLISVAMARIALLAQLVRLLLRDRAEAAGQTPEAILQWAEEIKRFFESKPVGVVAGSYLTAAVDEFFNLLASEMRQDRGSP